MQIPWLQPNDPFPPVESALQSPSGLLAAGGELSPSMLLSAYRLGIFPWFSEGEPILWWSPDPRMVLFPAELKVSQSLGKTLRNRRYEVRFDSAFEQVMRACAAPRPGQQGTWISPRMIDAYVQLHRLGHAHSVETWMDGALAGGLYGMAIGRAFFGESMFTRARDASKIALVHLVRHLEGEGYGIVDCQMRTPHLASLGAREIPRAGFSRRLQELIHCLNAPGSWSGIVPSLKIPRPGRDIRSET